MPGGTLSLLLALSLLTQTTRNIERAFFQNDPEQLYALLSSRNHINLSLPEPISFSDQVSSQQTFFFFRQIYTIFSTFEFYPESDTHPSLETGSFVFKARWSFKNKKNNNQYVFRLFFYLTGEKDKQKPQNYWKISEIKAEKL